MAVRRRPHPTSRRSGRRRIPVPVLWHKIRARFRRSWAEVQRLSLNSWT